MDALFKYYEGSMENFITHAYTKEKRSSPTLRVHNNSADSGFASFFDKGKQYLRISKHF